MAGQSALGAGPGPAPSLVLDLSDSEDDCGEPALTRVRQAYAALPLGAVLETRSTVAEHAFAVRTWARRAGAELTVDTQEGVARVLHVRRAG